MATPRALVLCGPSIFALALGACPGDDGGTATTSGASSGNGETVQPSADMGDAPPLTTGDTTGDTQTTGDTSTGPEDTTMGSTTTDDGPPQVMMETSLGTMVIQLDDRSAPVTVDNFLAYVNAGFYDGTDGQGATIIHRVDSGFVIQGGGFTEALVQKPTMSPIVNESANGLSNLRGTIAMARTDVLDSATAQFFFNLVDNQGLDGPDGYAVFGELVEGLDVMDAIGSVDVDGQEVPLEPVIILSATVQ